MNSRSLIIRRLGGFSAIRVLSIISPLVALPILARAVTVDEWAAIGIGQSVGTIGAIVVSGGWNVTGPVEAARASAEERPRMIVTSMKARLILTGIAAVPLAIIAYLIPATDSHLLASSVALVTALNGLTIAWFAIGTGRVGLLAAVESVPRVVGNLLAAVLAWASGWIFFFPLISAIFIAIPLFAYTVITARSLPTPVKFAAAAARLRERDQTSGLATQLIAGAYSMGAGAIVGVFGTTQAVAIFNSGFRLTVFGSAAFSASSAALHGWIAESEGPTFVRRVKVSIAVHTAIGVAGFAVFAIFGPLASRILFGQALAVPQSVCIPLGLFYALWSIETVTGRHVLVTCGEIRTVLITTSIGSTIGIPAVAIGARLGGASGASWGLAGALGLIVALQTVAAGKAIRRNAAM